MSKLKKGKSWCATCENREKGCGDSTDCRDNSVMERPFWHLSRKSFRGKGSGVNGQM